MSTSRSAGRSHARIASALAMALLLPAASCGQTGGEGVVDTAEDAGLGALLAAGCYAEARMYTPPGFASARSSNGMAPNGLTGNGLCQNGLAGAGLDLARMSNDDFATWFDQDPRLATMVVKYLYRCAAPEGQSLTWTDPSTGISHTWYGGLGLAPGWVGGAAATTAEQQTVSACLASLTNKFGVSVKLAMEGRSADGAQIPITDGELSTYSVREGCFFGNLFAGEGLYVGLDHWPWDPATSSVRACAAHAEYNESSIECPPIYQVGYCRDYCVLDSTETFYEECTVNGVSYHPLTTRILPSDVYSCGDGECQLSESCGTGDEYDNCASDCGACP